jgi:glutamate carboxypeptidase
VNGRAGHAAQASRDKASAITALAHMTLALEALTGQHAGVTVNVGRVEGGIGPNSVPETARAEVDVRFVDPEGQAWIEEKVRGIVAAPAVPGTAATVTTVGGRPPMPATEGNRALFRVAESQAARLGLSIVEEHRSGVSDANFIAAQGVPVLDGLGPVGELDHSDREYILASTLVQRCQLLALTLDAAWREMGAARHA